MKLHLVLGLILLGGCATAPKKDAPVDLSAYPTKAEVQKMIDKEAWDTLTKDDIYAEIDRSIARAIKKHRYKVLHAEDAK